MSRYSSVALICSLLVAFVHAVPEGRIVGGSSAVPGQFPYQVSIKLNGEHNCGGSIISKKYILTAAHCVVDKRNNYVKYKVSSLTVKAGTTNREKGGVRISVAETIVHPRYFYEGNNADIALVRLAKPLKFSKDIQPIDLSSEDVPENSPVIISGWGSLWQDGANPKQLQWTVLQSLSQRRCDFPTGYCLDKLLCLGHPRNKGMCKGDSGGPAVVDHRLVGIASFVVKECGTNRPDGYVKVSSYFDWIKAHSKA